MWFLWWWGYTLSYSWLYWTGKLLHSIFDNEKQTYLSSNTPCQYDEDQETHGEWFTLDFFNDIKILKDSQSYQMKVGVPMMLLRKIDQENDLCNGTRL